MLDEQNFKVEIPCEVERKDLVVEQGRLFRDSKNIACFVTTALSILRYIPEFREVVRKCKQPLYECMNRLFEKTDNGFDTSVEEMNEFMELYYNTFKIKDDDRWGYGDATEFTVRILEGLEKAGNGVAEIEHIFIEPDQGANELKKYLFITRDDSEHCIKRYLDCGRHGRYELLGSYFYNGSHYISFVNTGAVIAVFDSENNTRFAAWEDGDKMTYIPKYGMPYAVYQRSDLGLPTNIIKKRGDGEYFIWYHENDGGGCTITGDSGQGSGRILLTNQDCSKYIGKTVSIEIPYRYVDLKKVTSEPRIREYRDGDKEAVDVWELVC